MREVFILENVLNMVGTGLLVAAIDALLTLQLDLATWRGLSPDEGLNAFVVVRSLNVISGLAIALLIQIPGFSYSCLLIGSAVFDMTGNSLILLSSGAPLYFLSFALIGVSLGGVITSSVIGLKIIRPELISQASGTLYTIMGFLTAAFGPILGYFRDIASDYNLVLYITISIHVLTVILYITAFMTRRLRDNDVTVDITPDTLKTEDDCFEKNNQE
ncbi:uncharacterized protein LOC128203034 [Mya arenaria]|uniref:uncharacterized protein LOC128203034 n=1 Tax=Mya arenaria TaxID=6604 RepID=UPI0022E44C8E|nr:uncharacterized protein LOC128203034 [Mya arenaria]